VKLWKLHSLVFRCPCCGKDADYAAQIVEGPKKGTLWSPAYWCEQCSSVVRARDTWLFGMVYGPLMAMIAAFALEAVPVALGFGDAVPFAFAAVCCAIVGWPLSRALSRHLVYWEPLDPRDPGALRQARLRRMHRDDD
jgi:hypothetical protein